MLPSGPSRTDRCFLCCAPTRQRLLETFSREEAAEGLSSICLNLLLGPKGKEVLTLMDRLVICPHKCVPRFRRIAGLQAQLTMLKLQVQVEAEAIGKDVLGSATTPGQDSKVWVKFRQHVIQNYVVGKLPTPSVNIDNDSDVCEIIEEKLNNIRPYRHHIKEEEEENTSVSDENAIPEVAETGVVDISAAVNNSEPDDHEKQSRARINLLLLGKPASSPEEDSESDDEDLFEKRPVASGGTPNPADNSSANKSRDSEPAIPGPSSRMMTTAKKSGEENADMDIDNKKDGYSSESSLNDSELFISVKDLPKEDYKKAKEKDARLSNEASRKSLAKLDEHLESSDDSDGASSLDDIFIKRPKPSTKTGGKQAKKKSGRKRKADSLDHQQEDMSDDSKDQDNLVYACPSEICREEFETRDALSDHFFVNHLAQAVKLYKKKRMFKCKKCAFSRPVTVPKLHIVNKDKDAGLPIVQHYLLKHVKVKKSRPKPTQEDDHRPTKKTRASSGNQNQTQTSENRELQETSSSTRKSPRIAKTTEVPTDREVENKNPQSEQKYSPPEPTRKSPRKCKTPQSGSKNLAASHTTDTSIASEAVAPNSKKKNGRAKSNNDSPVKPVKSKPGPKSSKSKKASKKSADNDNNPKITSSKPPALTAAVKQEPESSSNDLDDSEGDEDYESKLKRWKAKRKAKKSGVVSLQRSPRCGPSSQQEPGPWAFRCPICQLPASQHEEYVAHAWDHRTEAEKTNALQERVGIDIPKRIRDDLIEKGRNPNTFSFRNEYVAEFIVCSGYKEENYNSGILPFQLVPNEDSLTLQCSHCNFSVPSTTENKRHAEVVMLTHYLNNHFQRT